MELCGDLLGDTEGDLDTRSIKTKSRAIPRWIRGLARRPRGSDLEGPLSASGTERSGLSDQSTPKELCESCGRAQRWNRP